MLAVPEVVVRQNGTPNISAKCFSNCLTTVPFVQLSVPDSMTCFRMAISSLPKFLPLMSASLGSFIIYSLLRFRCILTPK